MTSPVEAWVAHVAEHTAAKSVHWIDTDLQAWPPDVPSRGRREHPAVVLCARRREDVSASAEFLTRAEARARFWPAFRDCMRDHAMYVLPYVLGRDTGCASAGVQITDDPQLVAALARRMYLDNSVRRAHDFVRSVHSLRAACAPAICCFANGKVIWAPSVASSDFLDARPHALRLSSLASAEGSFLPARMAVVRLRRKEGSPLHFGVVAPAALGRPASLLGSARRDGRYRTLGAEVAWLTVEDGRLHAVLCERPPPAEELEDEVLPPAVPLDALVYCTRRAVAVPLVLELTGWARGVYAGTTLAADAEASASVDPLGMRSFCGVDLGEYLDRWLALGTRLRERPKLFQLNWFLHGQDGSLLWPGLFESWRVVDWMTARIEGRASARATAAGFVPTADAIERSGLAASDESWRLLFDGTTHSWMRELEAHAHALAGLGVGVPLELHREHRLLASHFEGAAVIASRDRDLTK